MPARISREPETTPGNDAVQHPLSNLLASSRRPLEDVAWHPHEDLLALAGGGRSIELWAQGRLVRSLGKPPHTGRTMEHRYGLGRPGGGVELQTETLGIPLIAQGYSAVAFSATGDRLVASRFGGGASGSATEVYDVATGALIDSFWRTDTTLALHPEGVILATLSSNQMASAIRFVQLGETVHGYDVELAADADEYARLLFNPTGDALAIVGHADAFGVKVYRFPECRLILAADLESWEDIWKALWARHRRNEPDFIASDAEEPPYELIGDLPCVIDRIAFSPDGQHLLIGSTRGAVVEVNWTTSKPVCAWPVHDGPVVALDASPSLPVLATAEDTGRIKLWRLKKAPVIADQNARPITAAFLEAYHPIDPMTPENGFRITDGKRWYDPETIGEDELEEDAPPWAQIARLTSLWSRDAEALNERAETDPFARTVQSLKNQAGRENASDKPPGTGEDPASE